MTIEEIGSNGLITSKDKRSSNTWTKLSDLIKKRSKLRKNKNQISKDSRKRNQ